MARLREGSHSFLFQAAKRGGEGKRRRARCGARRRETFSLLKSVFEGTFVKSIEHADTGKLAISGRKRPEMKTHLQWPLVVPSRLEDAARDAPVLLLAHTSVFVIVVVIVLPIVGRRGSTHHKE